MRTDWSKVKKVHEFLYESWSEFVEAALGATDLEDGRRTSRRHGRGHDWDLDANWSGAMEMAQGGWSEGAGKVPVLSANLDRHLVQEVAVQTLAYDVTGDYVDVGVFLDGTPECMGSFETEAVERPVVRVVVNLTASARVSADVLERRGMAVLSLINALERTSRRCEVFIGFGVGSRKDTSRVDVLIRVKRPDEKLNPALLAFAVCHPAVFRRLGFSLEETFPKAIRDRFGFHRGGSYGFGASGFDVQFEGDLYLPAAHGREAQWSSVEAAQEWVKESLRAQGVTLTESV